MPHVVPLDKGISVQKLRKLLSCSTNSFYTTHATILICPGLDTQPTQERAVRNLKSWYLENVKSLRASASKSDFHVLCLIGFRPERLLTDLAIRATIDLRLDPRLRFVSVGESDEQWRRWIGEPTQYPNLTQSAANSLQNTLTTAAFFTQTTTEWLHSLLLAHVNVILARYAERAHDNHHISYTIQGGNARGYVDQQLRALRGTLATFVNPNRIVEFENGWKQIACSLAHADATQCLCQWASYLDECCALLKLEVQRRRVTNRRHHILVVEDNREDAELACTALRRRFSRRAEVRKVLVSEMPGFDAVIKDAMSRCEEPSSTCASFVFNRLVETHLDRYYGNWSEAGAITVMVVDVRWHPACSRAGLEFLRLVRDRYPCIRLVALTVRRGVGPELADQRVDGYVVKTRTGKATAEDVGAAVASCMQSNSVLCSADMSRYLTEDINLRWVVRDRYNLVYFDKSGSTSLRLLISGSRELEEMLDCVEENTVVAVAIEDTFSPTQILELARLSKRAGASNFVTLHQLTERRHETIFYPSSVQSLSTALRAQPPARFDTRWTFLIPKSAHYGPLSVIVDGETRRAYRYDLATRFGGATAAQAEGIWYGGAIQKEIRDEHERLEIWGRNTAEGREHVLDVARRIMKELNQEEVIVEEQDIRTYSVTPSQQAKIPVDLFDKYKLLDVPFAFLAAP